MQRRTYIFFFQVLLAFHDSAVFYAFYPCPSPAGTAQQLALQFAVNRKWNCHQMKIELSRRRTRQRERPAANPIRTWRANQIRSTVSTPLSPALSPSLSLPPLPPSLSLSSLCRLIFTEAAAQINKKQTQLHFRFCIEYELYLLKIHECLPLLDSTGGSEEGEWGSTGR